MYCLNCGASNDEGALYCRTCGKPIASSQEFAANPSVVSSVVSSNTCSAQKEPTGSPFQADENTAAVDGKADSYAPGDKGCVSLAWDDVKGTDGWFKKISLLGLIQIVPILNFVVNGYAMQWGKQPVLNTKSPLPQKIFENDTFKMGFFYSVLSVVLNIIVYVIAALVGLVFSPLAVIAWIAATIFGEMFLFSGVLCIALSGRIGAGFEIGNIWRDSKGYRGKLICCYFLPELLVSLVVVLVDVIILFVIALLAGLIAGVGFTDLLADSSSLYSPYSSSSLLYSLSSVAGVVVIGLLLIVYVSCCGIALSNVISCRAAGYWTARYARQWAALAKPVPSIPYGTPVSGYGMPIYASNTEVPATPAQFQNSVLFDEAFNPDRNTTVLKSSCQPVLRLERVDGSAIDVSTFPTTLGKGSAADVQLSGNNAVSRIHLRLIFDSGRFAVEDLCSTNGTKVNGQSLQAGIVCVLNNGDQLTLGDETLVVRFQVPSRF